MTDLPLICNRCGECCTKGGACTLRGWRYAGLEVEFEGRCDFLVDAADATKQCLLMSKMSPGTLAVLNVVGQCNFPDWRREI